MIDVQNRVPATGQAGRVTLTPEGGGTATPYILEMADNPQNPGTPWSRDTGRLLQADIRTYPVAEGQTIYPGDVVDIQESYSGYDEGTFGAASIGDEVNITVDGTTMTFVVSSLHYEPSLNPNKGILLVAKDNYQEIPFYSPLENKKVVYAGSNLDNNLNNVFFSKLPAALQENILLTKIYVTNNDDPNNAYLYSIERKVFNPSIQELGSYYGTGHTMYHLKEGDVLPNAGELINCTVPYYTRSAGIYSWPNYIMYISSSAQPYQAGSPMAVYNSGSGLRSRPAFCVPPEMDMSTFALRENYGTGIPEYEITKDGNPSTAIALQAATAGFDASVALDGVVAVDFAAEGASINSDGVTAYAPLDGFLSITAYYKQEVIADWEGNSSNLSIILSRPVKYAMVYIYTATTFGSMSIIPDGEPHWVIGARSGYYTQPLANVQLSYNGIYLKIQSMSEGNIVKVKVIGIP